MDVSNYWTRPGKVVSRRAALRGALVAGTGLGAAALLGCGGDEDVPAAPGESAAPGPPAAPANGVAAPAPGTVPEGATIPHVAGAPTYGGRWRTGQARLPAQHDMHTALARTIWHAISERAFHIDPWTAEVSGNAVESWEILDDQGLEIAMHVRPGLALHDKAPWNGRAFDAEDLAWALEREAGLYAEAEGIPRTSFLRASMVAGLRRAEAVDDRTVHLTMAHPNGAIFNGLTEIRTQLMPKGVLEVGFDDPTKLASFGAFSITEYRVGERAVYEKHPNYYRPERPYFDGMDILAIDDRASMLAALIDGQTSALWGPLPHETQTALQVNPDFAFYEFTSPNWQYLRLNMRHSAIADIRVRRALSLATNRKEIFDAYFGPTGWSWVGAAHPNYPEGWSQETVLQLPGFNQATREEDRAEAGRLLEAAGYPGGAGVDFVILTRVGANEEHALRFQAQMLDLFPQMTVEVRRTPDHVAFATQLSARDFDVASHTITAVNDIFLEWHSQYHSEGSRNYGGFDGPEFDALIDRGIRALTLEDRLEIAEEGQQRFHDEWLPNLIFALMPDRLLTHGNIGGIGSTVGPWAGTSYQMDNTAGSWYYV